MLVETLPQPIRDVLKLCDAANRRRVHRAWRELIECAEWLEQPDAELDCETAALFLSRVETLTREGVEFSESFRARVDALRAIVVNIPEMIDDADDPDDDAGSEIEGPDMVGAANRDANDFASDGLGAEASQ